MTDRSILLDEGTDRRLAPWLRSEGRDVTVVGLDSPGGVDDPSVLAIAFREGRLLITRDNGFGRLVVYEGLPHAGGIPLRCSSPA